MAVYITIDGGTTNTRISLVCDSEIKDTVKLNIGAREQVLRDEISKIVFEIEGGVE